MPSHTLIGDLVTIAELPVLTSGIVYRPVTQLDRDPLAALYLAAYPPGVGVTDFAEACAEVDATFAKVRSQTLSAISVHRPARSAKTHHRLQARARHQMRVVEHRRGVGPALR